MRKKTSWIGLFLMSASVLTGADTLKIQNLSISSPLKLNYPIMMDSIDINKKKFQEADLLFKTSVNENALVWKNKKSNKEGAYALQKTAGKYAVEFARFYIETADYCKADISVKGYPMFEILVNGKSQSKKDNWKEASKTAAVTLEPGKSEVIIKFLSSEEEKEKDFNVSVFSKNEDLIVSTNSKEPLTIESLMTGTRLGYVSISAKGTHALAYSSLTTEKGKRVPKYSLVELASGRTIYTWEKANNLSWMPVSNALYFREQNTDGDQLVKLDVETLETTILTENLPTGGFQMTPDEKTLIFIEADKSDYKQKDVYEVSVPDDRIPGWKNRYNVFKFSLQTGVKERMTYGYHDVYVDDISADSKKMILAQSKRVLTSLPFSRATFIEVDLNTFKVDTLFSNTSYLNSVNYGLKKDQLLLTGSGYALDSIGLNIKPDQTANAFDVQAYLYDRKSEKIDPISKDFNPSISRAKIDRETNSIFFECTDRDFERIYQYDVASREFKLLPLDVDVVTSWSKAEGANEIAYIGNGDSSADEMFVYDGATQKSSLMMDPQEKKFENLVLGEVKDWNFESNGTTIEGRYYLPPNFDPNKKYPMIVYYYSGTTPTNRNFFHPYSMHLYAAQDYVVYVLQPSGTIGFGQEFAARHVNAWGIQTADDIITGVKQFCKEHQFVDAKKVGCMGASYGGFMTMYLQTRTDIFAAAVSHAGISALSSYWGEGYWGYSYSSIASAGSYPWNNEKLYLEQSPLFNADKINTPLLLLHGTGDTNVPPGESIQMFAALKLLGKEVNLIEVKGENHGIAEFNKRLAWKKSIFAFFAKHLKDKDQWWDAMYPEIPEK